MKQKYAGHTRMMNVLYKPRLTLPFYTLPHYQLPFTFFCLLVFSSFPSHLLFHTNHRYPAGSKGVKKKKVSSPQSTIADVNHLDGI